MSTNFWREIGPFWCEPRCIRTWSRRARFGRFVLVAVIFSLPHHCWLAANVKLGMAGALRLAAGCAQFSYPFHRQWGPWPAQAVSSEASMT